MVKRSSLLLACAILETGIGFGLVFSPGLVVRALLGAALAGAGVATARVAGLALLSLGLACWPEPDAPPARADRRAVRALLVYNGLAAAYFVGLLVLDRHRGLALRPAIVIHAVLAVLLARKARRPSLT